jgi:hypothetical protein
MLGTGNSNLNGTSSSAGFASSSSSSDNNAPSSGSNRNGKKDVTNNSGGFGDASGFGDALGFGKSVTASSSERLRNNDGLGAASDGPLDLDSDSVIDLESQMTDSPDTNFDTSSPLLTAQSTPRGDISSETISMSLPRQTYVDGEFLQKDTKIEMIPIPCKNNFVSFNGKKIHATAGWSGREGELETAGLQFGGGLSSSFGSSSSSSPSSSKSLSSNSSSSTSDRYCITYFHRRVHPEKDAEVFKQLLDLDFHPAPTDEEWVRWVGAEAGEDVYGEDEGDEEDGY